MARVIHLHTEYIKRSEGGSVVGFAAYCSGERLHCQYDGCTHYKRRDDVIFKRVLLPPNAPAAYADREVLWNAVEMAEGKKAQLARIIDLDFPIEVDRSGHIELVLDYVQRVFVDSGMCADIAIHDKGKGNPHAHVILTLRSIDKEGKWQGKWRKNYTLDDQGHKIYDPVTRRYQCGPSIPVNDWGNRANAELWRREWADACNRALRERGLDERVTHESYERQGITQQPQIHLGRKVMALKQRGIETNRWVKNREIIERNRLLDKERQQAYERKPDDGRYRQIER